MSGIDVQVDKEDFQGKDSFWNGCENTGLVWKSNQVKLRATRYLMACFISKKKLVLFLLIPFLPPK